MAVYATTTQFLARHDVRLVNELCNDDGVRQSQVDLLANANLTTAIGDASGTLEGALLVSGRYSTTELEALTGNSASLLQRVTCDIAMCYLLDRRPSLNADEATRYRELANMHLESLRKGTNIFNIAAKVTAGKPTLDGPKNVDYQRLNLMPERTLRYYPSRAGRLPTDRG